jgi:hypothetical protein
MTKITDITASYARCKLLKNFDGYGALLQSEDKWQLSRDRPRPLVQVEVVAVTVSDE